MSNAATHMLRAATMVGGAHVAHDLHRHGQITAAPVLTGGLATLLASLPDWIEPATNPHHRQFFHSVTFACALGYGTYRLYQWEPETTGEGLLRWFLLVATGAYLAHLICDAGTPRSLPLLGKLG